MLTKSKTLVSVIIINYNTFTLTSNCIRSLINHTHGVDYEIIVVDNASTEFNPELFLSEFPSVILIKSTINGGFAYGNNLGIQRANGNYILLLNSDTILTEDTITKSILFFKSQHGVGVLGCRMIYPDNQVQYTARRFRSISWELLDFFRFIPMLLPYEKRSKKMLGKYFQHDKNIECDWVNGAFFLSTREAIEKLPEKKLDDRFFMYGEDQLWCEQIRSLGYKILFFAESTIIHISSASTTLSKHLFLRKIMMENELAIMKLRKGTGFYYYTFKVIYVLKETIRNFIKSLVYKFTGRMIR